MRYAVGGLAALLLSAACGGGDGDKSEIRVGLLAPLSGRAQSIGESFSRVAETAVNYINEHGGVDGHDIVLAARDTGSDADQALTGYLGLVEDEQVVAVIGPALSDSVGAIIAASNEKQVPFISPSSTAASLIDVPDDDFKFRNVPNDDLQAVVQAYFVTSDMVPNGPITSLATLYEDTGYGRGLDAKFAAEVACRCPACALPASHHVDFAPGLSLATAGPALEELAGLTPAPEYVMVVAVVKDGEQLVSAWDPGDGPTDLPNLQWFMTDGLRANDFLDGLPDSMAGMMGTAPTVPENSEALAILRTAYNSTHLTDTLDDQVFGANVWDASFLIAAGLAAQMGAGEQLGGAGLREALLSVSAEPGQIFHAGQWPEMMAAALGGAEIDYDGASGPNDFDSDGETTGPFEVWEISGSAGSFTIQRVLFLPAAAVQQLIRDNPC